MALPKEIFPNPLITSTVEIRFSSNISEEDVLSVFYPIFSKNFQKIKETNRIPIEIKNSRPEFKFLANYILQNDKYSLSIGSNVIAFENIGKYQLWENYFPMIKDNLLLLKNSNVANSIIRIGIRYASIFENKNNINDLVKFQNSIEFKNYKQENQFVRSNFSKDNINHLVQISNNIKLERGENTVLEGLYVDIDTSSEYNIPNDIDDSLFKLIDLLHDEQKSLLFEGIMEENFLKSLNVKY